MITAGVRVLNVGLPLIVAGVDPADVVQLDWRPPAFGDAAAARLMVALDDPRTHAANERAVAAMHAVRPQLIGVRPAAEVIPMMAQRRLLLHAGPPIDVARMCGPMLGALMGAAIFEGWATDGDHALEQLRAGQIEVAPCHHHGAVGPMAGVLAPSMPVVVVADDGRHAFASLNEGLGKVLRFGAYDDEVLARLAWMRDVLGPALDSALHQVGPVDVTSIVAQALMMGDEGHNRNVAATSLFTRRMAPAIASVPRGLEVLRFLADNDHFMLNISMAAAKLATDAAVGIADSTIVTAMSRNGVEFGLRVAGTGEQWFTAPVGPADGLFFPGYSIADANPDLGDSAITETLGLGGFAMAASPAITQFVGGTPEDALATTRSMRRITARAHPAYSIASLNFTGTPSGIDVLRVLDTGVLPVINTGIAHQQAGIGQIGAGIVSAPPEVFLQAVAQLSIDRKAS
ncbi:MAG: DUF1116 domain-containing protein [Candidatus Nanopelagicales bacterium]